MAYSQRPIASAGENCRALRVKFSDSRSSRALIARKPAPAPKPAGRRHAETRIFLTCPSPSIESRGCRFCLFPLRAIAPRDCCVIDLRVNLDVHVHGRNSLERARESLEIAGTGVAIVLIGAAAAEACRIYLVPVDVLALCWTCLVSGIGIYLAMRVRDRCLIPVALLLVALGLAGPVVAAYRVATNPSMVA